MNGWKTLALWILGASLVALMARWPTVATWTNANAGLASWVQAVFSVLAILASAWIGARIVQSQHRLEIERADLEASKQSRRAAKDVVSMLQYIAAKLSQTNVAVDFQLADVGNAEFYRDIAGEFRLLVGTLEKLPFSDVALHGHLETYLTLRRSADELVQLYGAAPKQGDGFYKQNRIRLGEIGRTCAGFQASLADEIRKLDPVLYEKSRVEMLRL